MIKTDRLLLHIDDDRLVTELLHERLAAHGFATIQVNDPTNVVDLLARHHCRVVLLDVQMPQVNGLEVLKQIKHYDGGILVVMLTGLVSMTTVLESMRRGAEACHFKPVTDILPLVVALNAAFEKI